jgi:hypothetical protein
MKKLLILILPLLMTSCFWTDHFEMTGRLRDKEWKALKTKETLLSQYDYLYEEDLFQAQDFHSESFAAIGAKLRIQVYKKLHPKMSRDDKFLLDSKLYEMQVSDKFWMLAIFGRPARIGLRTAGFESWEYGNKVFEFHDNILVSEKNN